LGDGSGSDYGTSGGPKASESAPRLRNAVLRAGFPILERVLDGSESGSEMGPKDWPD